MPYPIEVLIHEMSQRLIAISLSVDLLADGLPADPQQLQQLESAAREALVIVNELYSALIA